MKSEERPCLTVITGCDSGIGAALCDLYLARGHTVLAGYFGSLPEPASSRHVPFPLDLRSEKSITAFAGAALDNLKDGLALYAVVQNAGTVVASPVENVPIAALREAFEVNFFGAYLLTRHLIPAILSDRSRIVLVGSLAGRIALPYFSPYVSSKFAMEGFADFPSPGDGDIRVKTILFEPAAVATPIWNSSWERIRRDFLPLIGTRYRAVFEEVGASFVAGGNRGSFSWSRARMMADRVARKRPHARYIVTKSPILSAIETLLPDRILDFLIAIAFKTARR